MGWPVRIGRVVMGLVDDVVGPPVSAGSYLALLVPNLDKGVVDLVYC